MPTPTRLHSLHLLATCAALTALALPPRARAAPAAKVLSDRSWSDVSLELGATTFRCLDSVAHPQYPVDGELELAVPDIWRYANLSHFPAVHQNGQNITCAAGSPAAAALAQAAAAGGKLNATVRVLLTRTDQELLELVTVKIGGLELNSTRQISLSPTP